MRLQPIADWLVHGALYHRAWLRDRTARAQDFHAVVGSAICDVCNDGGVSEQRGHIPVLSREVLDVLAPGRGECSVDCTVGLGGHSVQIAHRIGSTGTAILNDVDAGNLVNAAAAVEVSCPAGDGPSAAAQEAAHSAPYAGPPRIIPLRANFARIGHELLALGLRADMLLADLGFASNQMGDPARGFSFQADGPLDMRMDASLPSTAADLVNGSPEPELVRILTEFGEERNARRIAWKIVQIRAASPILTTRQLAEVVRAVSPAHTGGHGGAGGIHPATRTFQALRIAVNDELGSLDALLASIVRDAAKDPGDPKRWLSSGARVAIISFHSLEDRLVKRAFAGLVKAGAEDLTKGCVTAGESELASNPRSRSAKLRAVRISK